MPRRLISEIIQGQELVVALPTITVRDVAVKMAAAQVGAVLVVEEERLVGIFTERDALNKVLAVGRDPASTLVGEVMAHQPQTILPEKPLAYALHMMVEGGFRHVPVVDAGGSLRGMVSARDALGQDILDLERDLRRLSELENSIGY